MGKLLSLMDRLTNVVSGMGTTNDKRTASFYNFIPLTGQEAEAGYRTSWLVRKIVDVPPFDMTREWRDWQADSAIIEKIEAEEKRLQLRAKCQRALVLSRLFGGGAIILGTKDADQTQPLNVNNMKLGSLTYLHVMSRWQLGEGQPRLDPADPWFMQPDYFTINAAGGNAARLHPSRVVSFVGQRRPEGSFYGGQSWYWGDPIMQSIGDAVKHADLASAGFASLIDEAKVDILKIPNLMELAGTTDGEKRLLARLQVASIGKSNWRALLMDSDEEWDQRQVTWAGIPDAMLAFYDIVAGAADIPLTRLLGQSPRGLQSTGDGEARDYHSMVRAQQETQLAPALDVIDEALIRSALGSKPTDVYYEFGALDDTNEKDEATIEFQYAQAISFYSNTGIFPDQALYDIAKGRIIESGRWPGSETAFEEAEAAAEAEPDASDPNEPAEPNEADVPAIEIAPPAPRAKQIAAMKKRGSITADQATALTNDAAPRTLYVSRKLLNADTVIAWAKGQGFATTVPADQMHVTVLYSKTPVDWMQMGQPWDQDSDGNLKVAPGGPRMLDSFGSLKDATVLLFNSSSLCWRHEDMISKGATSDYSDYAPHVTITYDAPADLDLTTIEPYQGELIFGPEVFAEIVDDWQSLILEE